MKISKCFSIDPQIVIKSEYLIKKGKVASLSWLAEQGLIKMLEIYENK